MGCLGINNFIYRFRSYLGGSSEKLRMIIVLDILKSVLPDIKVAVFRWDLQNSKPQLSL